MMTWLKSTISAGIVASLGLAAGSCASSKGDGSETHFICVADEDCTDAGSTAVCINGKCTRATRDGGARLVTDSGSTQEDSDARPRDSGTSTPGTPDTGGGCGTANAFSCVESCVSGVREPSLCVAGTWQCPLGRIPATQCADATCSGSGLGEACCSPNGQALFQSPCGQPCPTGYFHSDRACSAFCGSPIAGLGGAYSVSFNFTNATNAPVGMAQNCKYRYDITTCADGYKSPTQPRFPNKAECPGDSCGLTDTCPVVRVPVTSAAPLHESWDSTVQELTKDPAKCDCTNTTLAEQGHYRIDVPVFAATGGAPTEPPLYTVHVNFVLGDSRSITVNVPLDSPPSDAGTDAH